MSLTSALNIASSGLIAAQTGLRTTSDNISNLNTPGYIRKVADQTALVSGGQGAGVSVSQIQLAADKFLQAAGLEAAAASSAAAARSDSLDQAQSLFGDPNSASSFFNQLDSVFSSFATLSSGASAAARATAAGQVQTFLGQASDINTQLQALSTQADSKIASDVTTANSLLKQIDALNADISRTVVAGQDATGSENQQSNLIDQLSQLMDVKVSARSPGGVVVRSSDGLPLAGDNGAATLRYDSSGGTGQLYVTTAGGTEQPLGGRLTSGELKGLVDLRNTDLPGVRSQLSELVGGAVDALNAAHNANSAAPPPATLSGRSTWLSQSEAFSGLSGKTSVSITDSTGVVKRRVDLDFTASPPTIAVDGAAASPLSASTFASQLNGALGTFGTASFSASGALTINATTPAATPAYGVAVADDPANPSAKAGQSFSDFFGLNDLVTSNLPSDYATGLTNASSAGFTGSITLRLTAADGSPIKDVAVNVGAAATMGDLVSSLNASSGGVGLYGSFALDDATGALSFTPAANSGVGLSVAADTTARGAGGPSLSALFGIGSAARSQRTGAYTLNPAIAADANRLSVARFDYANGTVGAQGLYTTDSSGADALSQAGRANASFATAGWLPGGVQSVSNYAASVAASVANQAQAASDAQTSASAVATEASSRRSSVEGVNLDEELTSMTVYQQAYNANARMIQTVKDMYDTLLSILN